MTDEQFRSFLNLMMCSDPWPVHLVDGRVDQEGYEILLKFANDNSRIRGYRDWTEAFHTFKEGE